MLDRDLASAQFRQACGFAEALAAIAEDLPDSSSRQRSCLIGAMLHIEQAIVFLGQVYLDAPAQSASFATRDLDLVGLREFSSQANSQSSALFFREVSAGDLASFWAIKERYRTSADLSFFQVNSEVHEEEASQTGLIATDVSSTTTSNGQPPKDLTTLTANQCRRWVAALLRIEELLMCLDVEC